MKLKFITSNKEKIDSARRNLSSLGIEFEEKALDLIEIQSNSTVDIAVDKAKQAFAILKQPLFVSDHGWEIPALNGFPGPLMKYMNEWLSAEDFLNLMKDKKDKRIFRVEVVCYIDEKNMKYFTSKMEAHFIEKPRGEGYAAMRVVSTSPSGKSVAECIQEGKDVDENNTTWKEFAEWYKQVVQS